RVLTPVRSGFCGRLMTRRWVTVWMPATRAGWCLPSGSSCSRVMLFWSARPAGPAGAEACPICSRAGTALLHSNGLGQVSRLVYVRALDQGDVVAEQLQRNAVDDGRDAVEGWGHV